MKATRRTPLLKKMKQTVMKSNVVTDERLAKYFDYTKRALAEAEHAFSTHNREKERAVEFFDMALRYYSDAKHFADKGDSVTAFAALNYAHGWLDAGACAGFFLVKNNELFVVD